MLDVFNTPTPQTANYQEFFGSGGSFTGSGAPRTAMSWMKPRGASMVRIMLIGGGGGGDNGPSTSGGNGGGSGAVTSWIGPAIFIPDELIIFAGAGGTANNDGVATTVAVRLGAFNANILNASAGRGAGGSGAGGAAMAANYFTAAGIFRSTAGQAGTNGSTTGSGTNQPASTTTFLSGGAGGAGGSNALDTGGSVTPIFGYPVLAAATGGGTAVGKDGYFVTQPLLVGCGGAGGTTNTTGTGTRGGRGGIGCGGGGAGEDSLAGGGRGGGGAVFIWAW
jgi:hypothetical protein